MVFNDKIRILKVQRKIKLREEKGFFMPVFVHEFEAIFVATVISGNRNCYVKLTEIC